jgi:hypothetical protein
MFINDSIKDIRLTKYGDYDISINKLVEGLKNYKDDNGKSLQIVDRTDSIVFI